MTDDKWTNSDLQRRVAQLARNTATEEFDSYLAAYKRTQRDATFMTDQAKIAHAIAQYEEARMGPRPKPKFILHIDGNHFYAKPSRATLWDAVFVAIATATWLALIASIYLVFK